MIDMGHAMQSKAGTPREYIESLSSERKSVVRRLRRVIRKNLPKGFIEVMSYGMIGYVVPHSIYPNGYHVNPNLPLPFINIASQKQFIALYHMGIYADKKLLGWFTKEYSKLGMKKLDMGKSCIRFKDVEHIPYDLIGILASKMTPNVWIDIYEKGIKK